MECFELGGHNNRKYLYCSQRSFCFLSHPAILSPHGHVGMCSDLTPHDPPGGSFPRWLSESTAFRSCQIHSEVRPWACGLLPSSPPSRHVAGTWGTYSTDLPKKTSFPNSKTSCSILAFLISPKARAGILHPMNSLQALKDLQKSLAQILTPLLYPTILCNSMDSVNPRAGVLSILTK